MNYVLPQPEKHLSSQCAVETLLDGVVPKGVLYFRTPSGCTLSRSCRMRLLFKGVFRVASDNRQEHSHPAKTAFHRMKRHFSLCHPAKAMIYRTGGH